MQEREEPVTPSAAAGGEKVNMNEGREPTDQPKSPSVVAKKPASGAEKPACPECGKQFRTDAAVQTHRHAAHGTAALVVGDMTRCPECGSLVNNANMARHRMRKHGVR